MTEPSFNISRKGNQMKNTIRHVSLLALLSLSLRGVADGQSVDPGIAAMNAEDISVYVESVDGNQRWPWNGLVDIDFTFRCPGYPGAYAFVEMSAFYESAPGVTNDLPLSTLTLNGENLTFPWATTAGTYRVTWDAGKDAPSVNVKNAKYRVRVNMARYMILTGDPENKKVHISYLDTPDYKDGTQEWKDEYKTAKMALRLIQPHTNVVGTKPTDFGYKVETERKLQRPVSITKPYYIGVFECTREQSYMLGLEASRPSSYEMNDMRPRKGHMKNFAESSQMALIGRGQGLKLPKAAIYGGCVSGWAMITSIFLQMRSGNLPLEQDTPHNLIQGMIISPMGLKIGKPIFTQLHNALDQLLLQRMTDPRHCKLWVRKCRIAGDFMIVMVMCMNLYLMLPHLIMPHTRFPIRWGLKVILTQVISVEGVLTTAIITLL